VLARLWRQVEPVVAQPPQAATPESLQAPRADSPKVAVRKRRKASQTAKAPAVVRIWLLDRETPPPPHPSACDHAARLLRWVRENGYGGKLVLAMDLQKIYPVMCEELGWRPYRWQPVACGLRKLTGDVKPYRWVDGHRRRAYPI